MEERVLALIAYVPAMRPAKGRVVAAGGTVLSGYRSLRKVLSHLVERIARICLLHVPFRSSLG